MEDTLKLISAQLDTVVSEVRSTKEEVNGIRKLISEMNTKISTLNDKTENNEVQLNNLGATISELKKNQHYIEKQLKKKNLVFYNIVEADTENQIELEGRIIEIIRNIMKLDILSNEIEDVRRLGRIRNTSRPILVEFSSYKKKLTIISNAKNLKGTDIWVKHDLTRTELEELAKNKKYLHSLKSLGYQAIIKNNKIYINGNAVNLGEINNLIDQAEVTEQYESEEGVNEKESEEENTPRQTGKVTNIIREQLDDSARDEENTQLESREQNIPRRYTPTSQKKITDPFIKSKKIIKTCNIKQFYRTRSTSTTQSRPSTSKQ